MRNILSFKKSDKPSRRQPKIYGLGTDLENCEERTLLSGVAIFPAQAAEVETVETHAKVPKKVKFQIGVSNSSNATMYISLTSAVGTQNAQYTVAPMSSKSFQCKLPTGGTPYPAAVVVSVYVGSNLTRMDDVKFYHDPGNAAIDEHDTTFDFGLSQLDVVEWEPGFDWASNPRHK